MKILQVVHGFPPFKKTGVETLTHNLSKSLAHRHEVHVLYGVYNRNTEHHPLGSVDDDIVRHEIHLRYEILQQLRSTYFLAIKNDYVERRFKEVVEKIRPEIIHFQHLIDLTLTLPLIIEDLPSILTLNDYWLICPTTHFFDSEGSLCEGSDPKKCARCLGGDVFNRICQRRGFRDKLYSRSFKLLRDFCARVNTKVQQKDLVLRRQIVEKVIASVERITAISHTIKEKFLVEGLIKARDIETNRVVVLPPGIDLKGIPTKTRTENEGVVFGYIGGLHERKGVHILIKAFHNLRDLAAELRIYGRLDTSDGYNKYLLKLARDNSRIVFVGEFTSLEEPFSQIDVLVVPSIAYEGYGLVVQEAFAAKIPVIAADIGALNEYVKHMVNGLLFAPGEYDDLTEKMRFLACNNDTLDNLHNNFPVVKSVEQYAREYETIYNEIIGDSVT